MTSPISKLPADLPTAVTVPGLEANEAAFALPTGDLVRTSVERAWSSDPNAALLMFRAWLVDAAGNPLGLDTEYGVNFPLAALSEDPGLVDALIAEWRPKVAQQLAHHKAGMERLAQIPLARKVAL